MAAFLGLASARSLGVLPDGLAQLAQDLSRSLMIVAMAGLGFGVQFAAVRQVGPRVAVAVIGSLLFLGTFTLAFIRIAVQQG
jgi:uncharacterized membrane protein YadS